MSGEVQAAVKRALEGEQVAGLLPRAGSRTAFIERLIPSGATLSEAHDLWRIEALPKLDVIPGLPLREPGTRCPAGLVRVVVECVEKRSGGMSSFYGFEGYFASLLIEVGAARIWDARGERAT